VLGNRGEMCLYSIKILVILTLNNCASFTRVNIYRELRIHLYYKSILKREAYKVYLGSTIRGLGYNLKSEQGQVCLPVHPDYSQQHMDMQG